MADTKNIFISHVDEHDALLPKLKDLIARAGMTVRDGSINSDKPNEATSEDFIKCEILKPRIDWASTLVVLITKGCADSDWVNWEIECAVKQDKRVVGVYGQDATEADIPEALRACGDAAIVKWKGEDIVDAINGDLQGDDAWQDPETGDPRDREWPLKRQKSC
jgi:hypothetical protein